MALYAIGDLHLSLGADKPMDVFGGAWVGYVDKLRAGLGCIGPEDTTVLLIPVYAGEAYVPSMDIHIYINGFRPICTI